MNTSNRRLYNEIQSLKRRIDSVENDISATENGDTFHSSSISTPTSYQGDVVYAGVSTQSGVATSHLVYLDSSKQWKRAHAGGPNTGSGEMLGIALSNAPHTNGVLVQGLYNLVVGYVSGSTGASLTAGSQVYISPKTSGSYTTVIPSGSGETVRVVGHSVDSSMIYFCPSKDFVEIS
tara:strand:+ start:288 stop:821 length:534 start_codon:yes stop_codon:yes gene_type:complete